MDSNPIGQQKCSEKMKTIDLVDKINILIKTLESDLDACDFKWNLFVAAANNYKFDSLLKPFPSVYVVNRALDIERLREQIAKVPRFANLLQTLRDFSNGIEKCINDETIDLLYWCLISVKEPLLKSVNRTNVSIILLNLLMKNSLDICRNSFYFWKKENSIISCLNCCIV